MPPSNDDATRLNEIKNRKRSNRLPLWACAHAKVDSLELFASPTGSVRDSANCVPRRCAMEPNGAVIHSNHRGGPSNHSGRPDRTDQSRSAPHWVEWLRDRSCVPIDGPSNQLDNEVAGSIASCTHERRCIRKADPCLNAPQINGCEAAPHLRSSWQSGHSW
jgi:hypothetical protein